MSHSKAIVWFRRDLRLHDNPALTAASEHCDQVMPVFIHAPEEELPWSPGAASQWWLHESLGGLQNSLVKLNGSLVIARGSSLSELIRLIEAQGVTHVYWNRLYEPALIDRDREVIKALTARGIECKSYNASSLTKPETILTNKGSAYKVFTAYWRVAKPDLYSAAAPLPSPTKVNWIDCRTESKNLEDLGLMPANPWYHGLAAVWKPGEEGAHQNLERFLAGALGSYNDKRDFPAQAGTSRLSPHLHFGEISPRQILWPLLNLLEQQPALSTHLDRFLAELGWREFAQYVLFHNPETQDRALDQRFEGIAWKAGKTDEGRLSQWQRGKTGIPIVDAGMRELWHTGWMHGRVRMIVASFLTKNLGIHWLEGARWFWDTLVDADLANNTLGWQWTAGCGVDAAPYFRVFNPVRQTERFDAQLAYIHRWLPELVQGTDKRLLQLDLSGTSPDTETPYPEPMVDLSGSRQKALSRWQKIRALPR